MTQPPHDEPTASGPEELREQIEHTRQELGETVEALAAKTDVRARAKEKAAEVREQAAEVRDEVKEQAAAKAAQAGRLWQEKAPEPVRQTTARTARWSRDNRVLLLAGGATLLLWLACRRKR
ncbi:DUF3618 domain-containing protein [Streptomyces sp. CSDS2]|uniref:DUF3618 domain-containing protein n=1 Tax=Streptomyces sp. CSDS2 TaxID=3055051 RepID=UPI0025AFBE28|nr:DUF3618 domain-containing protein [Streptomyces sp. CSDS2]MDN3261259.1 DUF3618 domain-containing protein [Streptomyces sp. CSDS2]